MFFQDLKRVLRQNIRDFGMYIALFAIWIIFAVATDGLFLSSRNLSNLFNQVGYIAVLAVGMTLVIVIRHIDKAPVAAEADFLDGEALRRQPGLFGAVFEIIDRADILCTVRDLREMQVVGPATPHLPEGGDQLLVDRGELVAAGRNCP